ncbi:MAG: vitamin K epoxide reductase/DsbA family protein [Pseudobdellovibrionaceae bacterium]
MKNTAQKKTLPLLALVFTLLTIGVHVYLNLHHINLKLGVSSANSICNVSETLNCDTAAASPYAELFGIPMALLGALTNSLLLIFLLLNRYNLTQNPERAERYSFYLSSFILCVSIFMASISLFVLKSACPFCLATYALSFLTWFTLLIAYRPNIKFFIDDLSDIFSTEKWILGCLIAIPLLGMVINNIILDSYGYEEIRRVSESSLSTWQSSPQQTFNLQTGLQFQNSQKEPKIVLVEFADFLCSHCKAAYPALHNFTKSHPDVKLIFKNFPLDGICNSAVPHKGDGKRCELSYAALCAEKLSQKGWAVHHYIFDNQESIFSKPMTEVLVDLCRESGTNCEQMKACMETEEIHEMVKKMASEGEKVQIGGTPSIFLNGKSLPGGQLPPVIESAYRNIIK